MIYFKKSMVWGLKYGVPIGETIGFTIITILSFTVGTDFITPQYLLKELIVSAIVGFVSAALPVFYTIENWSTLKQTTLHFSLMLAVFIPCAIIGGWIDVTPLTLVMFIIEFVIIYICYWLIFYFYWKAKLKKINKQIKIRNEK